MAIGDKSHEIEINDSELEREGWKRGRYKGTKLTAAKIIARNPNILASLKILSLFPANAAIIAPTIITEEIAFVTDIKGVCKDGVTLQTT